MKAIIKEKFLDYTFLNMEHFLNSPDHCQCVPKSEVFGIRILILNLEYTFTSY